MGGSYYSKETHGEYELFDLGNCELEGGGSIANCQLAYTTAGELNAAKDNAILLPHMYSGSSKHMLDVFVSNEQALDPDRYFIILPNQFGNGLSSSPHNSPGDPSAFPQLSIGDDVRAQHRLVTERFGIEQLQLVLGWSMGAQQTYEWAVRYPQMVKRAAPIAGTAKTTPHCELFTDAVSDAITSDPGFSDGRYQQSSDVKIGLQRHAHWFALFGASTELYRTEGWREIGIESLEQFRSGFWEQWFAPMDPNNLLSMLGKWHRADVSVHGGGNLAEALGRISARVSVIAYEEDMFMPVRDCQAEQEMIPNSELCVLASLWGHFAPLVPVPGNKTPLDNALRDLLATSV